MSSTMNEPAPPVTRRFSVLGDPENIADPYRLYRQLREESPVHWEEDSREWLVSRYADVEEVLRRPDVFSSTRRVHAIVNSLPADARSDAWSLGRGLLGWMLFMDAPAHTRVRAVVSKALTPRVFETLHHLSEQVVDELLESAEQKGTFDFIQELSHLLPIKVVSRLLGVPREDFPIIETWSNQIADFLLVLPRPRHLSEVATAGHEVMSSYLRGLIAERRARPREDLLTEMVRAEADNERLSEEEIISTCTMLLFQGHETTKNLLANGLLALFQHPEALAELRGDPSLVPDAVEEMLRHDSPIQFVTRVPLQDVVIGGKTLQKEQLVLTLLASANRDAARFTRAETFDLRRKENRHLSFGIARHFCIGNALARMEARVVFERMLRRWPDVRMAPQTLEWKNILSVRALRSLHITVGEVRR